MKEWKTYKLSEIGQVIGGATPSTKVASNYDGDIAWITPKDLSLLSGRYVYKGERCITEAGYKSCSCQMLPAGSILFSSRAPIGYIAIAGNELCTNQGFKSVVPNPEIVNSHFLYYLLSYEKNRIAEMGSGTTFMEISGNVMKNIEVKLPDLSIQNKIAEILTSLDEKIENNKRINDNLEQQAQALYKSWFVDFEPFKDSDFVESELGLIPDGWRCGLLSELLAIKYGKDHKKLSDGDIPVYGSGGIMRYVDTKLYEGEAVLIPRKGSLNNVMYVNEPFWTVDTMFYSTAKESNSGIYSYLFLTNKDLASMNAGSAVPSMTTDILNNLQLIIPPKEVLKSFNTLCFILFKRMKQNIIENMNLGNQRDSLLPILMSGELKINDLDC